MKQRYVFLTRRNEKADMSIAKMNCGGWPPMQPRRRNKKKPWLLAHSAPRFLIHQSNCVRKTSCAVRISPSFLLSPVQTFIYGDWVRAGKNRTFPCSPSECICAVGPIEKTADSGLDVGTVSERWLQRHPPRAGLVI